jgi:hypothetical protein
MFTCFAAATAQSTPGSLETWHQEFARTKKVAVLATRLGEVPSSFAPSVAAKARVMLCDSNSQSSNCRASEKKL